MKKPVEEEMTSDLLEICTADLSKIVSSGATTQGRVYSRVKSCDSCHVTSFHSGHLVMSPQSFEKDDDSNGHIDFITAASVRTTRNH